MIRAFHFCIIAILFLLFSNTSHAQEGSLKLDFGRGGYIDVNLCDTIYSGIFFDSRSIIDTKGNIYLSGVFDGKKRLVLKLTPDGKPDLSFGDNGYLTTLTTIHQSDFNRTLPLQVDSDENIYLLSEVDAIVSIFKYNRFGQTDLTFGTKGELGLPNLAPIFTLPLVASAFKIDRNNNLYFSAGITEPYIAKFNQDGILDKTFGTNGIVKLVFGHPFPENPRVAVDDPMISDIVINSAGELFILGSDISFGGILAKLNQAGELVNFSGYALPHIFNSKQVSFDSKDNIYIMEYSPSSGSNQNYILKYNTPSDQLDFTANRYGTIQPLLSTYSKIRLKSMFVDAHDNMFVCADGTLTYDVIESLLIKINTKTMSIDSSFHSDGVMNFNNTDLISIDNVVVTDNGTIFASGNTKFIQGSFLKTFIINPDGTIKNSFTNQKANANSSDKIRHICLNEKGELYLSGSVSYNGNNYPSLTSITPDGNLNQTFGTNGKKIYPENINTSLEYIAIEKNGYIYGAGTIPNADATLIKSFITKTDKYGNRVSNFGTNGTFIYTPDNNSHGSTFGILFDQDSSLLIFANSNDGNSMRITKITRSGNIDLSYGNQGNILITVSAPIYGMKAVIDNNGSIYITGGRGLDNVFITKITNQAMDLSFGVNGFFYHTFPFPSLCSAIAFDSNNNLVISSWYQIPFSNIVASLYKLTSKGKLITEFGSDGFVTLPYTYFIVIDVIVDKNDNIFLFSNSYGETFAVAKVNASGNIDILYGDNGLFTIAKGSYIGQVYDKTKGVAYLYGTNYDFYTHRDGYIYNDTHEINKDIRIICLQIENANTNPSTGTILKNTSTNNILLYPNPAKDHLQIKTADSNLESIQLVNITGSTVLTEKLSGHESVIKINALSPGIYFYNILDEHENSSQGKIIVE